MRLVCINYTHLPEYNEPLQWVHRISAFAGVLEALASYDEIHYAAAINVESDLIHNRIHYHFLRCSTMRTRFPVRLHRLVKRLQPDIVLVVGLIFPLQILQLRNVLGKKVKIIAEHHADKPPGGIKKLISTWADKCTDAYHFTSSGNAKAWIDQGIISAVDKCREIAAGSTHFLKKEKSVCRKQLALQAGLHFIWVGGLTANKDPFTLLKAFREFVIVNPRITLHLFYQDDSLLAQVQDFISSDEELKSKIKLHGKVSNTGLAVWYNACDYFISTSFSEGGSIALLEAMACGCIPIVTAIPSALKVIDEGEYGFYFKAGDAEDLFTILKSLDTDSITVFSNHVYQRFVNDYSFPAIAKQFHQSCRQLFLQE